MAKEKVSIDEKFENQDLDLFQVLAALDKKDYGYFDKLSEAQQKKFVPYMMLHWMSAIKASSDLQTYYLRSVDYYANKFIFNENVQQHPKLVWLMLCASSPGLGKQFHQWIPHLKDKVIKLKEPAKLKDVKEYFNKIYAKQGVDDMAEKFVYNQKRKAYLAGVFPNLKYEDIETLNQIVTDEDIKQYERDCGN